MPKLTPGRNPQPVTLTFRYTVDKVWIDEVIDATGEEPPDEFTIEFDLREVAPHLRKSLRQAHEIYQQVPWYPVMSSPTDDPAAIARAVFEQLRAEQEREAEEEALRAAEQEDERFKNERQQAETQRWIEEYGSPRLRTAAMRGYNVNRLYALERARLELPGFWVDFGNAARPRERANPTEEALDLEGDVDQYLERLQHDPPLVSQIVWLAQFPKDMQEHLEQADAEVWDEQIEALVVRDWLGRYRAFLPVDDDLRAPSPQLP